MDAALLSGTDADSLTILDVADTVALRVFEGDKSNDEIPLSCFWEVLIDSRDVLEESRVIQLHLVTALLKGYAKDLLALNRSWGIGGVYLDDVVSAFALVTKNLQRLICISRCNDAVAHFTLDDEGGCLVASITQSDKVAVAAHTVGTTGTGVCTSNGAEGHLDVIHKIDACQRFA